MFPTANPPSVSAYLLNEVATSGAFPDPALFVYGTVGILSIVFLALAYLAIGRPGRRAANAAARSPGRLLGRGLQGASHQAMYRAPTARAPKARIAHHHSTASRRSRKSAVTHVSTAAVATLKTE